MSTGTDFEADRPQARRCVLFVPADRPERYANALASGSDLVCVDLEDAVAPDAKDGARAGVAELLGEGRWVGPRSLLRVNHPSSAEGRLDLAALVTALRGRPQPLTVMVPKVDAPQDIAAVRARLPDSVRFVSMIETARGLRAVDSIAEAPGVVALLFGGVDLSRELGCALEWDALLYARSRVVLAAALAGIDAIDVPFLDVADADGLEREARSVRRLGFRGKAAIHPAQVGAIHGAFTPSGEEVERARRVLAAFEADPRGAFLHEGRMVDRPVLEGARRTLVLAADAALKGA